MNAYLRLIAFDLRLYFRDWMTIFWILVYPVLMLILFGSLFGSQEGLQEGKRYIDDYVPALCVMNVMSVSVFTLNINMIQYRESGILRRFRVTPVKRMAVLLSHAVQGLLFAVTGGIEVVIIAKLMWNIDVTASGVWQLLLAIVFGSIGFFSLGFALSGLTRTPGAASGLAMAIFFPMLFLSGISYPIDYMPSVLKAISDFIPMTYYVELAQGVWTGSSMFDYGLNWGVLAGMAAAFGALAVLLFKWENH
ncbi:ABC transporter permease [Paenibacillus protaetiae]|uniref:Transport permease protein n=1 Tax=Paenibacillus protaetiae TaxID=2509456 RepID=A0A4P6ESU2_9BACL|nr:ABC transporter permease [Paenibacillus protaetiae]QAY65974.1 ABC transporter permease [Paenibacillus protaetiae]